MEHIDMNTSKLVRLLVLPVIGIAATIGHAQTVGAGAAAKASAGAVNADFPSSSPEAAGVDSKPLIRMSEWIRNDKLDVCSLLVIKDGKLIFERYSGGLVRDNNYELYSVTKSITSLLGGVLNGDGKLGPNDTDAPRIAAAQPGLKDG